jgi:hypothetical protein
MHHRSQRMNERGLEFGSPEYGSPGSSGVGCGGEGNRGVLIEDAAAVTPFYRTTTGFRRHGGWARPLESF